MIIQPLLSIEAVFVPLFVTGIILLTILSMSYMIFATRDMVTIKYHGIAVDSKGRVYLGRDTCIVRLPYDGNPDEEEVIRFSSYSSSNIMMKRRDVNPFMRKYSFKILPDDRILVDRVSHCEIYDANGNYLSKECDDSMDIVPVEYAVKASNGKEYFFLRKGLKRTVESEDGRVLYEETKLCATYRIIFPIANIALVLFFIIMIVLKLDASR